MFNSKVDMYPVTREFMLALPKIVNFFGSNSGKEVWDRSIAVYSKQNPGLSKEQVEQDVQAMLDKLVEVGVL